MFETLGVIFIAIFFLGIILTVVLKLRKGTNILVLGKKDKRELIFGFGYLILLYLILAGAYGLPLPATLVRFFWNNDVIRLLGVIMCILGTFISYICIGDFWKSVRIGVDYENAGELTTDGIYARSRNPMYLSFILIFLGEFLIFPNLGLLLFVLIASLSFHLQILKEESFLKEHYGDDYLNYFNKVSRYF